MSNGFNPLSMFKPTGNPVVQKLLENRQTPINALLDQQSFPTQFRRQNHELLQKYMTYKKYQTLVQYITQVGDQNDKNRGYKYPFIAAQILSLQSVHTFKYFILNKPIIEQQVVIEQIEIEQEVESDRSFMSSRSQGSIISDQSQVSKQSIQKQQIEDAEAMPQIQFEKTPSQINEDDFPFIEQVKKVKKIKQKKEKIFNHQYQPLICRLFDFFTQPFNHTLTGYVCKVLNALLSKNPSIYSMFLKKAQTTLFLSHIESRSTQQLLVRIITYENDDENDITFQYNILMICLHKIYDDKQNLVVQNLSFMICQVLNKVSEGQITSKHYLKLIKQILRLSFFSKLCQYFQQCVKQLEESRNDNDKQQIQITQLRIKQFAKITTNFLDLMLKIKQKQSFKEDLQIISHQYEDSFNKFTESAYKKLQFQAIEDENKIFKGIYGITKILLINLLFTLIKENLGFAQQILAEKQCFFEILLQLVKKSPLNSILHNSVFSIFQYFIQNLNKSSSNSDRMIIGSLFRQVFDIDSKYGLLHFCYETLKQNQSLKVTQRKGYSGHLLKICLFLHKIGDSKDEQLIEQWKNTQQWLYIEQKEMEGQLIRQRASLGSYTKRKNIKAGIQFDKDKILQKHKQFLKGTRFTTLQQFENLDEQESDNEQQLHHHAGHVRVDKETQKQIEQMERQQFEMNAGMKGGLEETKDSVSGVVGSEV